MAACIVEHIGLNLRAGSIYRKPMTGNGRWASLRWKIRSSNTRSSPSSARFGLELHPEKTRLIEFGRFAPANRQQRGEGKAETFTFLGFTHYCATNSTEHFVIRRKTMVQRMRATLHALKAKLGERLHDPVNAVGEWLKCVVDGYYRYMLSPTRANALLRAIASAVSATSTPRTDSPSDAR
jgi:hypothetical protein